MDVIWLSHFIPFPVRGGAAQRSYNLLRQVARHHRVSLFAFNRPEQGTEMLEASRRELASFCKRVEFWELPFRWRGAAWWTHMAVSPFVTEPMSVRSYRSARLLERWRGVLAEYEDALVHIDTSDLAAFVRDARVFPTVLNHHNCESSMLLRRASQESNPAKGWGLRVQGEKHRKLEAHLLHQVAMNVAVSGEDEALLRSVNAEAPLRVVDNGTDTEFFRPADCCEEKTIVFAGSLSWYPNLSGLMFFSREVWPVLKARCPGIRFIVTGQNPPRSLVHWARADAQVVLVANPEDIRPFIARGAVFVCPILDGGGSRLKLLDAMAMGKAIVSTRVGAEGLRVTNGVHMIVVDHAGQFADEVLRLLNDDGARRKLATEARRRVVEEYSWSAIGDRLMDVYEAAVQAGTNAAGQVTWRK